MRRSKFTIGACVFIKAEKCYAFVRDSEKVGTRDYFGCEKADGVKHWYFARELILLPAAGPT